MNQAGAIDGVTAIIARVMMAAGNIQLALSLEWVETRGRPLDRGGGVTRVVVCVGGVVGNDVPGELEMTRREGEHSPGAMWQAPWVKRVQGRLLLIPHR